MTKHKQLSIVHFVSWELLTSDLDGQSFYENPPKKKDVSKGTLK